MPSEKMEIVLAENAGFCMGVRRALNLTLEAANDPQNPRPIATHGPLIHNRQVLKVLEEKGVKILDGKAQKAGTVVIRAHGISPGEKEKLKERAEKVIDATCPRVRNVQKIAAKYSDQGYQCVIVGDRGHAEVEGVLSYTGDSGFVVSDPNQVENLPELERVVVVAQTTQDEQLFERTVERMNARYDDCLVFNTICRATHRRQSEAKELAGLVDSMIVVGGYNSANTCRLAQICAATGATTYHVETDEELPIEKLLFCQRIGITAGASTPNWMIRRVIQRIKTADERRRRSFRYLLREILAIPVWTNLLVGGGASAVTFMNARLMKLPKQSTGVCMALAFFFVLSQHLFNQYARGDTVHRYLSEPGRGLFFRANSRTLVAFGAASGALALFLSILLGWAAFAVVLLGTAGGLLYCLPAGSRPYAFLGLRALQRFPGSKEVFVGLAWAFTTALVPVLAVRAMPLGWPGLAVAGVFTFTLAFQRALLTDLRDVEGDQLVGRETLGVVLGERSCRILLSAIPPFQALLLFAAGILNWTPPVAYVMLFVAAYGGLSFQLFRRGKLPRAELGEALIDTKFYLCGLLAFLHPVW